MAIILDIVEIVLSIIIIICLIKLYRDKKREE